MIIEWLVSYVPKKGGGVVVRMRQTTFPYVQVYIIYVHVPSCIYFRFHDKQ